MRFELVPLLLMALLPLAVEGQERQGGAWQLTTTRPVRDDQPSITLELDALNVVRGRALTFRPALFLRCINDKLEAYVATGAVGAATPDYRTAVRLRWNDGPSRDERWTLSTDYAGVFPPDAVAFVRQLVATPQLSFELRPANTDPIAAQFNGEGLAAYLPNLEARCRGFAPARDGAMDVDESAELLSMPAPEYPPLLRRAGIQGSVIVQVTVDSIGRVVEGSARVVSSGNAGFDDPALRAVAHAIFRPARLRGRKVRMRLQVPVEFTTGSR